jgi:hypothetical protein
VVSTLSVVDESWNFQVLTSIELDVSDRPGVRNDAAQAFLCPVRSYCQKELVKYTYGRSWQKLQSSTTMCLLSLWPCFGCVLSVRAGQGKRGKNYFPPLPSIESLRSKVFLKALTELFKAELVHLATRLSFPLQLMIDKFGLERVRANGRIFRCTSSKMFFS